MASEDNRRKDATQHTRVHNQQATRPDDPGDFERVSRGLVAQHPTGIILDKQGRQVIDVNRYDFLSVGNPAPDTVHPSLWRHAQLNHHHGLFEVMEGVWQVRGYDISNITFLAGETGWLVIDPLTTEQTARDSYALVTEHLGERPVVAVIYTHSHTDHFGGVLGVTTQDDVDAGRCIIVAPEHFLHEAVSENVIAGPAMSRRALFQFGPLLPADPKAHVDCGLGNSLPIGAPALIAPTHDISHTGEEMVIDGIRVVFQLTPETEAPAEMNFYFPDKRALCMAENCSHTMHNLIPIRGALVRNALNWSKYINQSMELFGADTDVLFTSHNWPRWGNEDVIGFLTNQRDLYKWMHDQSMRLANHGFVATEIAETLKLPEEFLANDHTRGYYGDLVHNSKAVYQRYLSWYDGNPANLNRYPPVDAGRRYVELAGGADALLGHARAAFDNGDYRWVVELVNHLVFAEPDNTAARDLQADALEQLGYQAESSTFRNAYLNAAQELRNGPPKLAGGPVRARGLLRAMTVEQVFDTMAIRLKSEEVGDQSLCINWSFTDIDEQWILGLSNRTLYYTQGRHDAAASAAITMTRTTLIEVLSQQTTIADEISNGTIKLDGDAAAL
ncbi:MAG TPA: alkyl sulfatase dimerization domain-containing protein, partial [Pseudomonadales bacterium]|nr:alkyl sulfatase dimerization domain-containing protein [Pseudomonadales bacterium]